MLKKITVLSDLLAWCVKFLFIKALHWGLRVPNAWWCLVKLFFQEVIVIWSNIIDFPCLCDLLNYIRSSFQPAVLVCALGAVFFP